MIAGDIWSELKLLKTGAMLKDSASFGVEKVKYFWRRC